jgi:hypothetical protein
MQIDPDLGKSQPEFLFRPGESIVNSKFAQEYRNGTCTLEQFDEMKLVVLEVGVDAKTGRLSYSLLHNAPGEGAESFSWGKIDKWFLNEYVEQNFENCDYPAV